MLRQLLRDVMSESKPFLGQDLEMLAPDSALWHLAKQDRFHEFLQARYPKEWHDVESLIYPEWNPHIAAQVVSMALDASINEMETQRFKTALGHLIKDYDEFVSARC